MRRGLHAMWVGILALVSTAHADPPSLSDLVDKCEKGRIKDCRRAHAAAEDDYDQDALTRIETRLCALGDAENCLFQGDMVRACELRHPVGCHNLATQYSAPDLVLQVLLRGCVKGKRDAGGICAEAGEEAQRQGAMGAAAYLFDNACRRGVKESCATLSVLKKQRIKIKKVREQSWSAIAAMIDGEYLASTITAAPPPVDSTAAPPQPASIEVTLSGGACADSGENSLRHAVEETLQRPTAGPHVTLRVELWCGSEVETTMRYDDSGRAWPYETVKKDVRADIHIPGRDLPIAVSAEEESTLPAGGVRSGVETNLSLDAQARFRTYLTDRRDEIWRAIDRQ